MVKIEYALGCLYVQYVHYIPWHCRGHLPKHHCVTSCNTLAAPLRVHQCKVNIYPIPLGCASCTVLTELNGTCKHWIKPTKKCNCSLKPHLEAVNLVYKGGVFSRDYRNQYYTDSTRIEDWRIEQKYVHYLALTFPISIREYYTSLSLINKCNRKHQFQADHATWLEQLCMKIKML